MLVSCQHERPAGATTHPSCLRWQFQAARRPLQGPMLVVSRWPLFLTQMHDFLISRGDKRHQVMGYVPVKRGTLKRGQETSLESLADLCSQRELRKLSERPGKDTRHRQIVPASAIPFGFSSHPHALQDFWWPTLWTVQGSSQP